MRSSKFLFIFCALLLVSSVQVVSAGSGYSYVTQWNSTGQEGGGFNEPVGIAVDSAGNVYVVDYAAGRVQKFDSSGTYLPWSSPDLGSWSFGEPVGIAVDRAGNIYVTNWSHDSPVEKFDSSGRHLPWSNPDAFTGPSNFLPYGIAVDSAGNIYVCSFLGHQVLKFDSSGTLLTWGDAGNPANLFNSPFGVAVDSADNVYVTDLLSSRVLKFDSAGRLLPWTPSGLAGAPFGVAVDSAGNVFVTGVENLFLDNKGSLSDGGDQWIKKFDSSGNLITQWGSAGTGNGQFIMPYGVAVDSTGNVFVADGFNSRIQKFSPDGPSITANFYAFGHVGQAPYSVRFLDQSTSSPTAWKWDFGDGSTSTEQSPTHIYNQTGAYNVALTASNGWASDTAIQYRCIIVNAVPTANFTANQTAGRTPFTVQFTDQSSDASGYRWQFGDGTTSTDQNPIHTYTDPGSYTVTLVASAADYGSVFAEKTGYIMVTDPPTVGFSANVTAGLSPLAVQFNESTTGSVQYYYWQFGDGATSFDRNPVHIYNTAGRYTVSLYAIGSNGTQVKTIEQYINVTAPGTPTPTVTATATITPVPTAIGFPPLANFTVTPQGSMGILVTDTSVNATSVQYDLGDGTTTTSRNFQYTYWQAGTYTIRQTATSAAGSSTKNVTVTIPMTTPTPTTTPIVIGGNQGWYTIHCNVDGATVLFDQTSKGTIADGILKIQVYTTGSPYRTYTVQKDGYTTVSGAITDHPGKDQNVDITVYLTPASGQTPHNGPHTLPGILQAEDYDLGGEGVAYHDTTSGNTGGVYRQDDVDIEVLDIDRSPNVGWIRAGEWLTYTVNVSTAGTYDAGFRVASSHTGSSVRMYVDDGTTPVTTVTVPNTGDWPVFRTVSVPVTLPAGTHRLKLSFPTDFANINWISFAQRG